jgi:hypothetical protein
MDTLIAPPPSRFATVIGAVTALTVLVGPLVAFLWAVS